ncbi:MAG: phospholipase D family protein [Sphingomonadales bacterium]|nr:phospholipase D family protein [Sphingomonadales bacterium]
MFETEKMLRCAVAFWGPEFANLARRSSAMVILDISMGCTSKATLDALGVGPEEVSIYARKHVRVLDGLHAKFFLGTKRCIIGSANASGAALGRAGGPPSLFEAAIEIERRDDPDTFKKLEDLWKAYLDASREVGLADRERAPRIAATNAARDRRGEPPNANSILQTVMYQPERFSNTAFAFGDWEIDNEDLDEANAGYVSEYNAAPNQHGRSHIFTSVLNDEVDNTFRFSDKIINFWFGRGSGLYTYYDIVRVEHDNLVSYYGRRSWPQVRRAVSLGNLAKNIAWQADHVAANQLANLAGDEEGARYVALSIDALCETLERCENPGT